MSKRIVDANSGRKSATLTTQKRWGLALRYLVALIAILFALFPVIWIISASLNPTGSE